MARYLEIHPQNPQSRAVEQATSILRDGGLVAYPTDSGYALGAAPGNQEALDRIRSIRRLDDKHHFTLVCKDFAQLGQLVHLDNAIFRAVKNATPLLPPKKKTVGVRIPDHVVVRALLDSLGEPILSSTLILPGETEPMTEGWLVKEELDHLVDAVVESGDVVAEPTTVVDFVDGVPEVVREGAGDPDRFR